MTIYTAQQLSAADAATIKKQNISGLELMERAAQLAFQDIIKDFEETDVSFKVFCGIGNNGGDGLVIARKLLEKGYTAKVFITEYSKHHSADFKANLERLKTMKSADVTILNAQSELPDIQKDDILIDAIFGIGLNRALPKWLSTLIAKINTIEAVVYAIDLPSGLFPHCGLTKDDVVFKASKIITFQSPKLVFFLPDSSRYVNDYKVLDIGLDQTFLNELKPEAVLLERKKVSALLQKRSNYSHKGTYGHAFVIGGSYGMMGSVVLATKAALRSGAGKVTAMIPQCGYDIMQVSAPEAMVETCNTQKILGDFKPPKFIPSNVCFGIGTGQDQKTAAFFRQLLQFCNTPMVIDADGLNLLAADKDFYRYLPKNSILTPHPGELKRLIGTWSDDFEKIGKARNLAAKLHSYILIKGAHSILVTPHQELFINTTGNPGMATGGSGDVLAGLICGLLAQGYSSENAAIIGMFLHGLAGDLAVEEEAQESLIAGDLITYFGEAFKQTVSSV